MWSESTWPLSSALSTPRAPLGLSIQTANLRSINLNIRALMPGECAGSVPSLEEILWLAKVGQIIARGDRKWLIRNHLGRHYEAKKRNYDTERLTEYEGSPSISRKKIERVEVRNRDPFQPKVAFECPANSHGLSTFHKNRNDGPLRHERYSLNQMSPVQN